MTNRPDWDVYYMQLAIAAATRATCPRRATGAVIVQGGRVIATGYNGAPKGLDHCPTTDPAGHPDCMEHGHCVRAVHAEINAILACAAGGASTQGATLYCTTFPCHRCIGPIVNAGISRIVFFDEYKDASHAKNYHGKSFETAIKAGIKVERVPLSRWDADMDDGDLYRRVAARVFNVTEEQVTDEQRRIAKGCGMAYGIYSILPGARK